MKEAQLCGNCSTASVGTEFPWRQRHQCVGLEYREERDTQPQEGAEGFAGGA